VIVGETHVGGTATFGYEPWGEHVASKHSREHYARLREIQASSGCLIVEQLFHPGLQVWPSRRAVARGVVPGLSPLAGTPGGSLSRSEWNSMVDSFVIASARACEFGLGVEIKADQGKFLDDLSADAIVNLRSREMLWELFAAVNSLAPPVLGVRVRGDFASTPAGHGLFRDLADEFSLDYVSLSAGTNATARGYVVGHAGDSDIELLRTAFTGSHAFGGAVTLKTGAWVSLEEADDVLADGSVDLVGLTRAHIADCDLLRVDSGDAARPCTRCNQGCVGNTFEGQEVRCSFNAFAGLPELERVRGGLLASGDTDKRVAVIGAGVAGAEAALQLAFRGARVTLFERSSRILPTLEAASTLSGRAGLKRMLTWYKRQLEVRRVEIRCGAVPSPFDMQSFDIVLLCTGADRITSLARPQLATFEAALASNGVLSGWRDAIVYDSVWSRGGLGVAATLSASLPTTYVTPLERPGGPTDVASTSRWMAELQSNGGSVELRCHVVESENGYRRVSDSFDSEREVDLDTLVVSDDPVLWRTAPPPPHAAKVLGAEALTVPSAKWFAIGDVVAPRGFDSAVREATATAAIVSGARETASLLLEA
jgi:2,4-dienoyl-CoA reductase-like NADH-dependent reductase (Old Yellow Enzyme family)